MGSGGRILKCISHLPSLGLEFLIERACALAFIRWAFARICQIKVCTCAWDTSCGIEHGSSSDRQLDLPPHMVQVYFGLLWADRFAPVFRGLLLKWSWAHAKVSCAVFFGFPSYGA